VVDQGIGRSSFDQKPLVDEQCDHAFPSVWRTLHSRADSTDRVEDVTLEAGRLLALDAVARFMQSRAA